MTGTTGPAEAGPVVVGKVVVGRVVAGKVVVAKVVVAKIVMRIGVMAAGRKIRGGAALAPSAAARLLNPSLLKMNATDVPSLYSSLLLA
jgi:hypothetical protein